MCIHDTINLFCALITDNIFPSLYFFDTPQSLRLLYNIYTCSVQTQTVQIPPNFIYITLCNKAALYSQFICLLKARGTKQFRYERTYV